MKLDASLIHFEVNSFFSINQRKLDNVDNFVDESIIIFLVIRRNFITLEIYENE